VIDGFSASSRRTLAGGPALVRTHVVRPGETLARLAVRYGVDYRRIAVDNGLPDPNLVRAGRILRIGPSTPPVPPAPAHPPRAPGPPHAREPERSQVPGPPMWNSNANSTAPVSSR
jgi:LysM repeat protein